MMKRKIKHGFLGLVHVVVLAFPLLIIFYLIMVEFSNGFTAVTIGGVASESLNYDNTFDLSEVFDEFNTNYSFTFGLVSFDFVSSMEVTTNISYVVFLNWYMNYLINFELILFLPEVLLMFISIARHLILRWDNKLMNE